MSRTRIVYSGGNPIAEYRNGELVWSASPPEETREAFHVMGDITPYQSQVDGSMIEGRRQHREHLRQHNLIEVGNETKHLKSFGDYTPKGVKQDLIREVHLYKERNRRG